MNRGFDDDGDPCLSKALLLVSDEFDLLSCLCDANSFILVALAPCTTASSGARWPNPHPLQLFCLCKPNNYCTVNFFVGSSGTATTSCRRRPLVIGLD